MPEPDPPPMRPRYKRDFARHLRRQMTHAERRLWYHLRNRAFLGCKFRRQHPIGPYIADFACLEAHLVVELDGGQHSHDPSDPRRQRFIEHQGFRMLRFWNNDVLHHTHAVLSVLHHALQRAPAEQTPP